MTNSIIVKNALYDMVAGLTECRNEKWQLAWGPQKSFQTTFVYFGRTEFDYNTFERTGWVTTRSRDEFFRIKCGVNIKRRGKLGPQGVENELVRIYGLIEDAVNASHNIGVPAVISAGCAPDVIEVYPADDQIEGQLVFYVTVKARV